MNAQIEFDFSKSPFDTFLDNISTSDKCYCGKLKPFKELFYCSYECYLNNIKNRTTVNKDYALKLKKNWDESLFYLNEQKRLNDFWGD